MVIISGVQKRKKSAIALGSDSGCPDHSGEILNFKSELGPIIFYESLLSMTKSH